MKNKTEPYIVMLPINAMSNGRKALERIENNVYSGQNLTECITKLFNDFCFNEHDPCNTDVVTVYSLSDFMDDCNNEVVVNLERFWIGYVKFRI